MEHFNSDSKENEMLFCNFFFPFFIKLYIVNYTLCHLLELPRGGNSNGTLLSEPRLSCAYVSVLKIKCLRTYISALFVSTAYIAN